MSDYPTKMRRVEDLDNVDFQDLFEVKKLGEGGFGEVGDSVYIYCGRKKTNKLKVHPYRPVSWLPTHQGI